MRWIYFTKLWKKRCPKCKRGVMERKSLPMYNGRGPVEKMWLCSNCGHRTFMIVDNIV
jgi:ribosomal protein S27AE